MKAQRLRADGLLSVMEASIFYQSVPRPAPCW
ncbi:hypothetical protein FOXG_22382 [Fusarium oxysporum f. sp. lycopersici 4287]|nr:hypothetical protein FOXG_19435 [Fusarium oxysporum f. sp. lycopersici 4287]XP_018256863.1 hypothetical protein FOXG_22382 [Fusarium oxysporum f. sp. lycopersici 4287]KNB04864.1 hypothetical protein FOXG_19435 [Fusarium oxysporum f. sp. lycopersici 4287]KNB18818.1 hypothetical protein FOXG_22382 [Fusarium oxysporum f. sp. lycopersici 4287]